MIDAVASMIREISADNLSDIDPVINQYRKNSSEGVLPDNYTERLKTAISEGKACVYGSYSDDGFLEGIAQFGKVSKRINFVYADRDLDIEKRLVSALFDRFTKDFSHIVTGGPWISEDLSKHILAIGFSKYDRMYMTLPREDVESLAESPLPEDMAFELYTENLRDEISKVVFKGNDGHVDQSVFPEFFGSVEACHRLLENIEGGIYGEYREASSWILRQNGSTIGVCLLTIRDEDMGYIPDIVINKEYRGKGLGKSILVHSMKRLLESESALVKVDLDVTLSNDARFLYKSLGFTKVREYTMYTWQK